MPSTPTAWGPHLLLSLLHCSRSLGEDRWLMSSKLISRLPNCRGSQQLRPHAAVWVKGSAEAELVESHLEEANSPLAKPKL